MSETAKFTYGPSSDARVLLIEEPETFLHTANLAGGVPIFDARGKAVGTVYLKPVFDPDEVPGLTNEDREDIRDARAAMKDVGFITLVDLEAELVL